MRTNTKTLLVRSLVAASGLIAMVAMAGPSLAGSAAPGAISTPSASKPGPDAGLWRRLADEVIVRPEFEALPLRVSASAFSSGGSPLEMRMQGGQCELRLRVAGNPQATIVEQLAASGAREKEEWINALLVHEIAHCWRWLQQDSGVQALEGSAPARDQARLEESIADAVAVAWSIRHAPETSGVVLDGFRRLRGSQELSGPHGGRHDTRDVLNQVAVMRDRLAQGRPFFEAGAMTAMGESKGQ